MADTYRVADYVAEFLALQGVKHVFMLPGGGAMFLNDGLAKCAPAITAVPCLHEQACAIAAEAYSRIDNQIGVAMVTTGPGATNAITAVAGAWIESVPMVIISGQVKRADLLKDSGLRQRGVQEVDIVSLVRPITKYAKTLEDPTKIGEELEMAWALARAGRAGPVWIDLPLDVQGSPCELKPRKIPEVKEKKSDLPASVLQQLEALLEDAKRPLILAGHGVRLAGAAAEFREVVESLSIPVVTTWNALDLLPYEHPLCVGRPGVVALRGPNFAVQNCDLLIAIGSRLDNIVTAFNPQGLARGAKKVIVDVDEKEINKLNMTIDLKVVSDARSFLRGLAGLKSAPHRDWVARCQDWKKRFSVDKPHVVSEQKINHYHLVRELSKFIPENTLVSTGSSGLAVEFFYTLFQNKPGQRVFLTSGLGSMGYGLPAAIGSCFANGKRPMVAVESDGSLQLNVQELATMRAFNLPICLVIMNNNGYASIRNTQRNYFASRFIGTGPEAGLWLPDLAKLAAGYEIPYLRIDSPIELPTKLQQAMRLQGPLLLDVHLENNESLAPKVAAIPQKDGSMVSMPLEDMTPLLSLAELEAEMLIPLLPQSRAARQS